MKRFILLFNFIVISTVITAQYSKRELTFDDILKWNRITEKMISNNGEVIVYKEEPWKGDSELKIVHRSGKELLSMSCGNDAKITSDSKFVVFTIKPTEEEVKQLKLKETEEKDMPLNQLAIFNIDTRNLVSVANLKTVEVPYKWDGWIAYQTRSELLKDTTENSEDKIKEESDDNGFVLNIKNLESNKLIQFPFVTNYVLAQDAKTLAFVSTGNDKDFDAGLYLIDLIELDTIKILNHKGDYKQISFNNTASKLAFIADTSDNKKEDFALYLWSNTTNTQKIVGTNYEGVPNRWEVSSNGKISFAKEEDRIFFGIAPKKPEKDSTVLDEDIPKLDIWRWNDPILYTQQINTKSDDLKKSYLTVYHINSKKLVQLENQKYTGIELIKQGDSDYALAWSYMPYAMQTMWEGYPEHHDFYLVDINTGEEFLIKQDCLTYPQVSPEGNYIYWYNYADTSWNTYHIGTNKEYKISNPDAIQCADELNDVPNYPDPYGEAGWLKGDRALLVYDRFDTWKIDPKNESKPENITQNGRSDNISYRLIDFENDNLRQIGEDKIGLDPEQIFYFRGHNEISREDAYYKLSFKKSYKPEKLLGGKFYLSRPFKARDADVYVFTKETFSEFPDLLVSTNQFKKSLKISNANPQQDEFLWGTKELYSWTSLDGQKLEGLLIKPANFDPNKKYPLIVNFYEKSSQELFEHQIPEAHRSTVDYHYYSSNGYIIFNPDVYYKEGYPGESAYNCVMPGVTALIDEGFVDANSIAAQGHSWGGYQVAYLATRTNLFAAIESGAPVVNMFSAYGGIRLWSGRNRSFQYEHTQSRIGKSIWESPLRYLENSPLFTADKITTPMLIMHNEGDGAVPFSQGVEFYIALRRLGKEAWLLNYNEADHWPTIVRDKYDFQIRLAQFFDHYLKGKPMPFWMKEGIPAVEKGFKLGYELE
ncbi:MAG: peptidase S9 [Marinilabiliales bacterium]|nr:MAG: peptidase S9 [Marinilabiliales bacterium]